ncbi:unnamed protein product [Moneuplotes crassus]|uniref:Uncharacterized protein n=1 Tax=Euplotes crassus TaxID=5936 RepID=A0AAD1U074_EUPCR|nr:unnamed protein product [Moneuplotes crassus]
MATSCRELEDDIIIAHNEIRENPEILIHELEDLIDEKKTYYTPSTHMASLIGASDLKDIAFEVIQRIRQLSSTSPLVHTRELELAARDHSHSHQPEHDLIMRVENYTNWDGELNEIVHYSKATARGIDVLMNMAISDYIGDTKNIETMFGYQYKYFGVRVTNHDLYDFCVVIIYAQEVYSTVKSALQASSKIDEELREERELLARNIAKNDSYNYDVYYARENPNVQVHDYMNKAYKSKRKVRLNEDADGERTFTVLRRDSLERNTEYAPHNDQDYQYIDKRNSRLSKVSDVQRNKPNRITLGPGERIYHQTTTDYDRELYSKNGELGGRFTTNEWDRDPYPQRYTLSNQRDYDAELYYADLNDVTRREESIVSNYPTVSPELTYGNSGRKGRGTAFEGEEITSENVRTIRSTAHTPRQRVNRDVYAPVIKGMEDEGYYSSQTSRTHSNIVPDDGIEVTYEEEPMDYNDLDFRVSDRYPAGYDTQSIEEDVAAIDRASNTRRQARFIEDEPRVTPNYKMTERETFRTSKGNRIDAAPISNEEFVQMKGKRNDDFNSPGMSSSKRTTAFTTRRKIAQDDRYQREISRFEDPNLSDSF